MPDNLQSEAFAIIILFPILSTLFVILRGYSRWLSRQFGWDTKLSWSGYHRVDIPERSTQDLINTNKADLANQLLYIPILAIIRASIIVSLFRLEDYRPIVRWNLNVLFWVNLALMIAFLLTDLLQCTPMHYAYDWPAIDLAAQKATGDDSAEGGKCIDNIRFILASACMTILADIWLFCIPVIVVWRLQMCRRRKIAVIAVMSLGAIVTLIAIARLVIYAFRCRPQSADPYYNIGQTISSVEVNTAIITASAMALPALSSALPRGAGIAEIVLPGLTKGIPGQHHPLLKAIVAVRAVLLI